MRLSKEHKFSKKMQKFGIVSLIRYNSSMFFKIFWFIFGPTISKVHWHTKNFTALEMYLELPVMRYCGIFTHWQTLQQPTSPSIMSHNTSAKSWNNYFRPNNYGVALIESNYLFLFQNNEVFSGFLLIFNIKFGVTQRRALFQ